MDSFSFYQTDLTIVFVAQFFPVQCTTFEDL